MLSIGEFSRISGLSVKTLRFYHERGLLTPSCVDDESGYRYYDQGSVEKARVIARLREMEFSLGDIKEMLDRCDDQADILDQLERQKRLLEEKARRCRSAGACWINSSQPKGRPRPLWKTRTSKCKKKFSNRCSSPASA